MKRFLMMFAVVALAIASAKNFSVTLFQTTVVAGTELKAGDYRLSLENDKVVLTNGKQKVESTVKVEEADAKFSSTTVRYASGDKNRVQEIRLGGTKTRLVFDN